MTLTMAPKVSQNFRSRVFSCFLAAMFVVNLLIPHRVVPFANASIFSRIFSTNFATLEVQVPNPELYSEMYFERPKKLRP